MKDPNHFLVEPEIPVDRQTWEAKQTTLRERLLLFAGLWPEPKKNALNPEIFGEKRGEGFRVFKVYFESLPGFYVTGNLYRPDQGSGPFPAILSPHGHTQYGRLNNDRNVSIVGRCIDFARQGYVVLSIDMVGYNDSLQLPHDGLKQLSQLRADQPVPYEHRLFRAEFIFPQAQLYGLTLGGLQLWNGIRSIDFLTSLEYVDAEKIGVTGCSGGATQTTWLMVADTRVKAAAPVNIIGTHKHPGCLCENIPGLWIDMSMPELAAAFAPRPLILVSATEDPWTNQTPTRELPLIQEHYRLLNAVENVGSFHTDAGHNYNPESRRAVYEWFQKHLNPRAAVPETVPDYAREAGELGDLRVFPEHLLPESAKSGREIIDEWIEAARAQTGENFPLTREEYSDWVATYRKKLSLILNTETPEPNDLKYRVETEEQLVDSTHRIEKIGRRERGDWIELESVGKDDDPPGILLLAYPENFGPLIRPNGEYLRTWIKPLVDRGVQVFRVRGYASGKLTIPSREYEKWLRSDAYNRSNELNGIQDIITAISSIRQAYPEEPLLLAGLGKSGPLALFAAAIHGGTNRVIIDLNQFDPSFDGDWIRRLPITSIRKIGDLRTALLLLAQQSVTVFNPASTFDTLWYQNKMKELDFDGLEFLDEESSVSFVSLE